MFRFLLKRTHSAGVSSLPHLFLCVVSVCFCCDSQIHLSKPIMMWMLCLCYCILLCLTWLVLYPCDHCFSLWLLSIKWQSLSFSENNPSEHAAFQTWRISIAETIDAVLWSYKAVMKNTFPENVTQVHMKKSERRQNRDDDAFQYGER